MLLNVDFGLRQVLVKAKAIAVTRTLCEKGPPSFHNAVRDDGAFGAGLTDLLGFECAPHAHYGDKPSSRLEPQKTFLAPKEYLLYDS